MAKKTPTAKKATKKKQKVTKDKALDQAISKAPGKVGNLVRRK